MDNIESDNFTAALAKQGDSTALDALIKKYTPMVHGIVNAYNLPGSERDDLLQEGLIGLYGAILAFDENKSSGFYFFAKLVVTRRLQSAAKAAFRGKHAPLSAYEPIPLHIKDRSFTPEEALLRKEEHELLEKAIDAKLSPFEKKALHLRLSGLSSAEIAERLGCEKKMADNALFRARRKLSL